MDPVIIIGAGLSGLVLANVLKHNNIPYKLYERDASQESRSQGWSISLHMCLPYLERYLGAEKYATLAERSSVNLQNPTELEMCMANGRTDEVFLSTKNNDTIPGRPVRINRKRFRDWLLEGIDIAWDKELETIEDNQDGVIVKFKDGTVAKGSLLVGADGVRSRVARQRLGETVFWEHTKRSPVRCLGGSRRMTEKEREPYNEKFSRTMALLFGGDDDRAYLAFMCVADIDMTRPDPYLVQWNVSCITDSEPDADTDAARLALVKEWGARSMGGLTAEFIAGIPEGTPVLDLKLYERIPTVFEGTLVQHPRLTVMGDAAHCMTPYRGEGGNHAIIDAVNLGKALMDVYKKNTPLAEALMEYEEEMIQRGTKAVTESRQASLGFHGQSFDAGINIGKKIAAQFMERMQAARQQMEQEKAKEQEEERKTA
ncbi:hypothetical protein BCR43DRAFT_475534 [Syncephalastrum racemosum]|uniref:FAD-binding domain-containing protein n=1 Tax=Syncephalastrum racemosum TaxID=13706 RepID=A0A1X2HBM1_SYNRA|nr:hypothetical protein BCR43DRAFT_475534 [Syncephalastrum racemosum]